MVHTHLNTIETWRPCNNNNGQGKDRSDLVSIWMLLHPYNKDFSEVDKNGNFLTWLGLKNQQLLKQLPPSIVTTLGHLDQERKNPQSTKQFKR